MTPQLTLALFLLFQALDGIFTYVVVSAFGLTAEANQLLTVWMALLGVGPAIVMAKLIASACGALLYQLGVQRALLAMTILYAAAAVGPWLVVLQYI